MLSIYISDQFRKGALFLDVSNISQSTGIILAFLFMFLIAVFTLKFIKETDWRWILFIVLSLLLLGFVVNNGMGKSLKYTLKISPFYISFLFGLIGGYYYKLKQNRKILIPLILFVYPLLLSFGGYNLWIHRIEYGNFSGAVENSEEIPFELLTKDGELVTNETLKGKVVLFDFWYISCRPCWVKFPELQRIHDQYKDDPNMVIYAVNRPTDRDKPGELFSRIEDKQYTFPVLKGTQEIMDAFDVYVYPTVVLLNKEGQVVFMGELEDAKEAIPSLL
jgi:cytochrome oxidase Cu insertion factor (SCO1/SenC/PrrC family)